MKYNLLQLKSFPQNLTMPWRSVASADHQRNEVDEITHRIRIES